MHRLTKKRSPFPVPGMNAWKQEYDLKEFVSTFEDPCDISTLKSIFSTFDCHFLVGQQLTSLRRKAPSPEAEWHPASVGAIGQTKVCPEMVCQPPEKNNPSVDGGTYDDPI